jgi:hypothetical protein
LFRIDEPRNNVHHAATSIGLGDELRVSKCAGARDGRVAESKSAAHHPL